MIKRRNESTMNIRRVSLWVALCMLCTLLAAPASAAEGDEVVQTVRTLGIMKGDADGNMDLDGKVTRAQLAVMLTAASTHKDSVGPESGGYSLFKDVKSSHWACEYIRLAVQEGWMTGYTDGTFRPEQVVRLEEACSAVLKLLGYDSAALAGSFPSAQLNKASALGLRKQLSAGQGMVLTRRDCAYLFYNLMTAKTSGGQVYATTLGYPVTNGELDQTSLLLEHLSGPYVAGSGSVSLPFQPDVIYRNGERSASSAMRQYDVYYYHKGMQTLWLYTRRVYGKIGALAPSSTAPTSVTVADTPYQIGSAAAAYKLSAMGGGAVGQTVTLLLGMDDTVVDILTGTETEFTYYGIVEASSRSVNDEAGAAVQTHVTVLCTDGVSRTFSEDRDASYTAGRLVAVTLSNGGVSVKILPAKQISGKVNSKATKLEDLTFAEDIEILDTNNKGSAVTVSPSRLAGYTLGGGDVRYYGLNEQGELEYLILDDVTGDLWTYAYLSGLEDQSQNMSINVTYTWLIDGMEQTLRSSTAYGVKVGGVSILYHTDGSIQTMQSMKQVRLTALSNAWGMADNQKIGISENVQVYLYKNGSYYLTGLSAVNVEKFTLTGWYDDVGSAAGGQIRIIVAAERAG